MRIALALALTGIAAVATTASAGGAASRGAPQGFRPETAAAVGARDLWVLGEYRCSGKWCLALVSSTDGGKQFSRAGLPPFTSNGIDPTVVFTNAREGFAYVPAETPLYATHDGGLTWQRSGLVADVHAFATAGGYAYAVFGRERFQRSPVGRNAWQKLSLPFSTRGGPIGLSAHGSQVWIVGTSPSRKPQFHSKLGLSDDRGSRFVVRMGPCEAGLPGGVTPAGERGLWAVCSSGMMASLSLSTNDGRSFAIRSFHDPGGVRLPSLTNAASIAASSARVAILTRGAGGAFLRTTDAGRHWSLVPKTGQTQSVFWLGFTTQRVGSALVELHDQAALWRTTDGGATWHSVPIH